MPLEGDWQRAELARSVTLPILRWPNKRVQPTRARGGGFDQDGLCGRARRLTRRALGALSNEHGSTIKAEGLQMTTIAARITYYHLGRC